MKTLSWFDKLLMKIAIAKSTARQDIDVGILTDRLIKAFDEINSTSSDTSPPNESEARR